MVRAAAAEVSHNARFDCWIKGRSKKAESTAGPPCPTARQFLKRVCMGRLLDTVADLRLSECDRFQDFQIGSRGGRTARRCRGTRASGTSIAKCARIGACVTENL